jgi:hypothetical protein
MYEILKISSEGMFYTFYHYPAFEAPMFTRGKHLRRSKSYVDDARVTATPDQLRRLFTVLY